MPQGRGAPSFVYYLSLSAGSGLSLFVKIKKEPEGMEILSHAMTSVHIVCQPVPDV